MGDVIKFSGIYYADIPVDDVLNAAIGKLSGAIVIGKETDGYEYFASSYSDKAEMLWMLERFKTRLLEENDG